MGILLFLAVVLGLIVYMLPYIVAEWRDHRNKIQIFFFNVIFGWSIIGWLILLYWAYVGQKRFKNRWV